MSFLYFSCHQTSYLFLGCKTKIGLYNGRFFMFIMFCMLLHGHFCRNFVTGVSKDHKIVHKRLPNLQKAGNLWCQALRKSPREWIRNSASCCIDSVGLPKKPIIFRPRIIAVGRDYQMYFKNSVSSPWGFIQKSGPVSITICTGYFKC